MFADGALAQVLGLPQARRDVDAARGALRASWRILRGLARREALGAEAAHFRAAAGGALTAHAALETLGAVVPAAAAVQADLAALNRDLLAFSVGAERIRRWRAEPRL